MSYSDTPEQAAVIAWQGNRLAVGDGINDALALKAGAVGIATGSNGAESCLPGLVWY